MASSSWGMVHVDKIDPYTREKQRIVANFIRTFNHRNSYICEYELLAESFNLVERCYNRSHKGSLCKTHKRPETIQYIAKNGDFDYYKKSVQCTGHKVEKNCKGELWEVSCSNPAVSYIEYDFKWRTLLNYDIPLRHKFCNVHNCTCQIMKHKEHEGFIAFLLCLKKLSEKNAYMSKYFIPIDLLKNIFKYIKMNKWGSHWAYSSELPILKSLIVALQAYNAQNVCRANLLCVRDILSDT